MKITKVNIFLVLILSQMSWILLSSAESNLFNGALLQRSLVDIARVSVLSDVNQKELRKLDEEYTRQAVLCQQQINAYNEKIRFHASHYELYTEEYATKLRLHHEKQREKVSRIYEKTHQFLFLNQRCFDHIINRHEQTFEYNKARWVMLAREAEIKELIKKK